MLAKMRWVDNWHTFFTSCGLIPVHAIHMLFSTGFALIICVENDFQRMLAFFAVYYYSTRPLLSEVILLYLETVSCYALQVVASAIDYCWHISSNNENAHKSCDLLCFNCCHLHSGQSSC